MAKHLPITVKGKSKSDMRSQFAALCFRVRQGKCSVLLVTSRGTGRWIIPKGWPEYDMTPASCAAKEAWEEAGVKGRTFERCIGIYSYSKWVKNGPNLPCVVMVFPTAVKSTEAEYPEHKSRKRKWFSKKKAAKKVSDPELARIIKNFDPRVL